MSTKSGTMKKRIGYSPLTQKIYLGKQNKEKRMWVGEKEDITSDFIAVLMEFVGPGEVRRITTIDGIEENIVLNIKLNKVSIEKAIKYLQKKLMFL
ncbi:MAG: hypothetical protein PHT07_15475 [Paludibacter sp.]|nr:hypothetical protein [Paludibacter sp.]